MTRRSDVAAIDTLLASPAAAQMSSADVSAARADRDAAQIDADAAMAAAMAEVPAPDSTFGREATRRAEYEALQARHLERQRKALENFKKNRKLSEIYPYCHAPNYNQTLLNINMPYDRNQALRGFSKKQLKGLTLPNGLPDFSVAEVRRINNQILADRKVREENRDRDDRHAAGNLTEDEPDSDTGNQA